MDLSVIANTDETIQEKMPDARGIVCDDCGKNIASMSNFWSHQIMNHPTAQKGGSAVLNPNTSVTFKHFKKEFILRIIHSAELSSSEEGSPGASSSFIDPNLRSALASVHNERQRSEFSLPVAATESMQPPVVKMIPTNHATDDFEYEFHNNIKPHLCRHCGKNYSTFFNLATHIKAMHQGGDLALRCPVCDKTFGYRSKLKDHFRTHSGERAYSCSECPLTFKTRRTLRNHRLTEHTISAFACDDCDQSFNRLSTLRTHARFAHDDDGSAGRRFQCRQCPAMFSQAGSLGRHARTTHSDRRRAFECRVCERRFTQPSSRATHERLVHGFIAPRLPCRDCDMEFASVKRLYSHYRRFHRSEQTAVELLGEEDAELLVVDGPVETDKRERKRRRSNCPQCPKNFASRWCLKRHLRVHTGEKGFKCDVCELTLKAQESLVTHLRTHTGELPFSCDGCRRTFNQSSNFVLHLGRRIQRGRCKPTGGSITTKRRRSRRIRDANRNSTLSSNNGHATLSSKHRVNKKVRFIDVESTNVYQKTTINDIDRSNFEYQVENDAERWPIHDPQTENRIEDELDVTQPTFDQEQKLYTEGQSPFIGDSDSQSKFSYPQSQDDVLNVESAHIIEERMLTDQQPMEEIELKPPTIDELAAYNGGQHMMLDPGQASLVDERVYSPVEQDDACNMISNYVAEPQAAEDCQETPFEQTVENYVQTVSDDQETLMNGQMNRSIGQNSILVDSTPLTSHVELHSNQAIPTAYNQSPLSDHQTPLDLHESSFADNQAPLTNLQSPLNHHQSPLNHCQIETPPNDHHSPLNDQQLTDSVEQTMLKYRRMRSNDDLLLSTEKDLAIETEPRTTDDSTRSTNHLSSLDLHDSQSRSNVKQWLFNSIDTSSSVGRPISPIGVTPTTVKPPISSIGVAQTTSIRPILLNGATVTAAERPISPTVQELLGVNPNRSDVLSRSDVTTPDKLLDKVYPCCEPSCNKCYSSAAHLKAHTDRWHGGHRPHQCSHCGRKFTESGNLKKHVQVVHLGIEAPRSHQCAHCPKAFSKPSILRKHTLLHTRANSGQPQPGLKCDQCCLVLRDKAQLSSHRRSVHDGGGDTPFGCDECGRAFADAARFQRHRRTHLARPAFPCPSCDKGFWALSDLTRHSRRHTGERPFSCEECDAAFADLQHLARHRVVHVGEQPFQCPACDRRFNTARNRARHQRSAHGSIDATLT